MSDHEFTPSPLEKSLYEMYSAPTPSAEFSTRLRAELLERAKQKTARPAGLVGFWAWFNARLSAAGRVGFSLAGAGLLIALVILGARLLSQNAPTQPLVGSQIIETQPAMLEPTTTPLPSTTYTVQEGDTWASIAADFGMTVDELFAINGLDQNATLSIGQELIVGFTSVMPTPTPQVNTPTAEPIQEAHASGQPSLSPEACAAQIPFNLPERISPIHTVPTQILGGGTLTSGDFTFDLYLYCDNIFTRYASDPAYRSEITGLGVFLRWQYDGPEMTGETYTYTGIEPFVQYRGSTGPSLDAGKGYLSTTGLQVPQNILPDWSGTEFALRYVVIAQDPQGGTAGVAVNFRLVREKPGGFMVRDIQIEPLSEAELASPTTRQGEPPFPFLQSSDLDPILAEIEDLVLRHEAALTQQPGWIHWRRHITNPEPIQATSPNDVSIPAEYISDEWYRLDENGLVVRSVYQILTMEGQELMAGIYHNGIAYDLTLGAETPYIHTERMKFDFNFYLNAFDAVKSEQKSILKEPVYAADGSYLGEGFTVEISGQTHQAVFNPETGQMLELRVYQPDDPQDSPPFYLTQIEALEPAELPAELATLFEKEVPDFQPVDPQGTLAPEGFDPAALPLTYKVIQVSEN